MMTSKEYAKKIKKKNYDELIVLRDELVASIRRYEEGIPKDHEDWRQTPDPDVVYYHELQYLAQVYALLSEKFLKK
ncbi:MAG: hypothetical protein IKE51_02755, partial [Solobacterium sp.]|nr:hypothetical protein [Solobacterium sp.]